MREWPLRILKTALEATRKAKSYWSDGNHEREFYECGLQEAKILKAIEMAEDDIAGWNRRDRFRKR